MSHFKASKSKSTLKHPAGALDVAWKVRGSTHEIGLNLRFLRVILRNFRISRISFFGLITTFSS